ncbi:MAG: sigma-70 family RNA polymerase sigma factor [Candidatus Cloacimonadota bacterium]|nr:MAG: sigma-70 family RNA polymerase sigma factor [Candidatus Cloacimonadota bacterium]
MVDNNAGTKLDDCELVEKVKNGDERAFELLVKKYQKGIYSLTYRMTNDHFTADELTMEAFIRAYKAIKRFRKGANFFNWLYTIAVRLCLNYIKKEKRKINIDPENLNALVHRKIHDDGLLEKVIAKEVNIKIREAIQHLPEKLRVVLLLRVDDELSYEKISKILRIPSGTVMSRLNRARERLKKSIGNYLMS